MPRVAMHLHAMPHHVIPLHAMRLHAIVLLVMHRHAMHRHKSELKSLSRKGEISEDLPFLYNLFKNSNKIVNNYRFALLLSRSFFPTPIFPPPFAN